jgi:adenylate kinase family enzyme
MKQTADVQFVLYLSCSEEVMQERILRRASTSGRTDDNIDSIRKRSELASVHTFGC